MPIVIVNLRIREKKKRTRFPQMAVQVFYMFFFLVSGVVPKENTEKKISEFNLRRFVEGLCFVSYSSIHLLHLRIPQLVKYSVSTKGVQWTRVFLMCYLLRLNEDVFFFKSRMLSGEERRWPWWELHPAKLHRKRKGDKIKRKHRPSFPNLLKHTNKK